MGQLEEVGAALAGGGAIAAVVGLIKWYVGRRGDLIDQLRRALDRGLRRENALVMCCELLLYAIDHQPDPPAHVVELRKRAADVLEAAQSQIYRREEK
jgi:hypothetical protein